MKVFVDADSCPKPVREAVLRAGKRTGVPLVFAANRPIPGITGEGITMEVCPDIEGAADDFIVSAALEGDLVITRDIPLASRLVEQSVAVMDDRGRIYTVENIRERLSIRNFLVDLAENGMERERIASYGKKELKQFADGFDKILTKLMKAGR